MTTPIESLAPRWLPPDHWIERLDSALADRDDVNAAWFVTTRYFADEWLAETFQEELHLELADPPGEGGASKELFREFGEVIPAPRHGVDDPSFQFTFTFPTGTVLPRVRDAGALLWSRQEKA